MLNATSIDADFLYLDNIATGESAYYHALDYPVDCIDLQGLAFSQLPVDLVRVNHMVDIPDSPGLYYLSTEEDDALSSALLSSVEIIGKGQLVVD